MNGSCRITVVGPARRADLTLPADISVAELVPELVLILDGEPEAAASPRRWSLLRIGGGLLDLDRSLGDQAVMDGSMLFLRDASTPPPEPVIEDIVEAVAITVDVRAGRWSAGAAHALWLVLAGASILVAAGGCLLVPGLAVRAALGLGGGLLAVGAAALLRAVRQPLAGAVVALAGLPLWAVGGASAAALAAGGVSAASLVVGASAALTVGALTATLAGRAATAPAGAVAVAAAPLAGVAAVAAALGGDLIQGAAVLAVVWLAIADQLPRLARLMAGLSVSDEGPSASRGELRARVDRGHYSLAWLLGGAALGLTGAVVALGLSGRPPALALCAVAALAAGLRARHHRFVSQVVALAVPGLAGLLALEVGLLTAMAGLGAAGAVAGLGLPLATAAAALGLALGARAVTEPSPRRRRLLDALELLANLALIPLVVAAVGVFALVYEAARRLG